MISSKFNDDFFYEDVDYALEGGIEVKELKMLENVFLQLIDWKIVVHEITYKFIRRQIDSFFYDSETRELKIKKQIIEQSADNGKSVRKSHNEKILTADQANEKLS